jgi:hypothetical protein
VRSAGVVAAVVLAVNACAPCVAGFIQPVEFTCVGTVESPFASEPFVAAVPPRGYWFVPYTRGDVANVVAEIEVDGVATRTFELHQQGAILGVRAPPELLAGDVAHLHVDGTRAFLFDAEVEIAEMSPATVTQIRTERIDLVANERSACRASCFDPDAKRLTQDVLAFEYTGAVFVGYRVSYREADPRELDRLLPDASSLSAARVAIEPELDVVFVDARTLEVVARVTPEAATTPAPPLGRDDADDPSCASSLPCEG